MLTTLQVHYTFIPSTSQNLIFTLETIELFESKHCRLDLWAMLKNILYFVSIHIKYDC